ncbi:MAG: germination protein YpeB [Clostridia bacterium]|nr:germination protein YpeB [Clostridia bacterium]
MKKEKQEIAINTSSGAEKVETIEKQTVKKTTAKPASASKPRETEKVSAKGEAALGSEKKTERISAKEVNARSAGSKAEKESKAAKARVEKALKKKEEKAKKKAEKLALAQKRKEERAKKFAEFKKRVAEENAAIEKQLAQKKAEAEKHAVERKKLAEKRAAEREEKIRQRAHEKANRNKERSQRRAEKKRNATEKRQSRKGRGDERRRSEQRGYGGWLAAVVSLGVVTLALATTVTVGALEMRKGSEAMVGENQRTMYELTGVMENVDNDLDRARISASTVQQSRILTDLLVQARLAELDLEKMPLCAESCANVTTFINRTARECERMLAKLRLGERLSAYDYEVLESLYKTNHQIRSDLNDLTAKLTDKDWTEFIKKGKGMVMDAVGNVEKLTLEENRISRDKQKDKMEGAGMHRNAPDDKNCEECAHIDPAQAEELCKTYFNKYNVAEYRCVGETVAKGYCAYNVQGYDDKGTLLFAEISQKDGALLRFDYYEDCMGDTFDYQNAERIAQEFLQTLGYDDVEVVRLRENGSNVDFTFVYEDDGVVYYPDEIHVKVCRTRGIVSGFDAVKYIMRHKDRKDVEPQITLAQAYDKLHAKLNVESARLAVVDTARGEKMAYEFLCSYGEENYFVFLDAENGEEIAIVNTKNAQ